MHERWYNYLGLVHFEVRAPQGILERLDCAIPSTNANDAEYERVLIQVTQHERAIAVRYDADAQYSRTETRGTGDWTEYRHFRYEQLVRTIQIPEARSYIVRTRLLDDENAVLVCVRDFIYNQLRPTLVHASLVQRGRHGILIAGGSRSGKTTVALALCESGECNLVCDEDTWMREAQEPRGAYVPRSIRIRFSTLAESAASRLLDHPRNCAATQYFDEPGLTEVLEERKWQVDGGLCVARCVLAKHLRCGLAEESVVTRVLFPTYMCLSEATCERLSSSDTSEALRAMVRRKSNRLGLEPLSPIQLNEPQNWMNRVQGWRLLHGGYTSVLRATRKGGALCSQALS